MKKIVTIFICILIFVASLIGYDVILACHEGTDYSKIIGAINNELRNGKTAEEAIDYLRSNEGKFNIISITPVTELGRKKRCEISCKSRSMLGSLCGNRIMFVYINEGTKTADGCFAGM